MTLLSRVVKLTVDSGTDPSSVFGGENPNTTAQAIVFTVGLAIVAIIAVPVLVARWRKRRDGDAPPSDFVRIFGPTYLVVLAILWGSALPDYFGAVDGVTSDGTPIGNLAYAAVCFVVAALCVAAAGLANVRQAPRDRKGSRLAESAN